MFFGLTNSLAMFQTMINKILRDLIIIGKVVSFIDDMIVGMEKEEEHDEIVEEVVKRQAENDLYLKLEKCKWKVREIGFLEVVIGPEGIKIKKVKVKDILDWPTLKGVKNVQKFLRLVNYYQWFIKDFTTIARPLHNLVKKRSEVGLDGETGECVSGVEEKVYKRTGISNTGLELEYEDGS